MFPLLRRHGEAVHGVLPADMRPLRERVHVGGEVRGDGQEVAGREQDNRRVPGAAPLS